MELAEVGAQGLAEQAQQAERSAKADQIHAAHAAPDGQLAVEEGKDQVSQAEYAVKHANAAEGTAEVRNTVGYPRACAALVLHRNGLCRLLWFFSNTFQVRSLVMIRRRR